MYLETSAMYLLELHRAREADRRRELRDAIRRNALFEAQAQAEEASADVAGVSLGDRAGRGGDPRANVGRGEDLHPAPGSEQGGRRLVRPVQAQSKS